MRYLSWFVVTASVHFGLSVLSAVLSLRAAFAGQSGFWSDPLAITAALVGQVLQLPAIFIEPWLPRLYQNGYLGMALASVFVAIVVVVLLAILRGRPPGGGKGLY